MIVTPKSELVQPELDRIQTLAVYDSDRIVSNFEYNLGDGLCGNVIEQGICIYPTAVRETFPQIEPLADIGAESYAGMPIVSESGQPLGLIAVIDRKPLEDISLIEEVLKIFASRATADIERKRAEAKNREQAALLDVATDAIMVRGLDNQLLFWNKGAERLYGWTQSEALNHDATELLYRTSLNRLGEIQQAAREKGEWQGELKQVTKADKEITVESRWTMVRNEAGEPKFYLVVNTDITEQKQLEAQFLRTQRLESLGTLAGGIAHDLNNILAPILGFSKLLPLKLPDVDEQTKGFFDIMQTNAQRGTALLNKKWIMLE
ncbi:PAS domain S-box protein [Waterburya agarophytonicola K14]|uniref:histidine kinase n=1 Tax=Waterburya agarophytonicola KI4 TaxID=2874699 RepID=A0A964BT09_9CYAN|nr:PAS domain S-box protein [Waterburya agarophytonicola]MCC0178177.1 PAS domain S-box protein [Waterburya agarophytonicola KI4]